MRLNLIFIFLILFAAAIVSRLVFIQVINYEYWKALARGQQQFFEPATGKRGEIFIGDKDGNLYTLATNKDWKFVCASPAEIFLNGEETGRVIIKKLAELLNNKEETIFSKIKYSPSMCEILKRQLNQDEEGSLEKENLPGVHLKKETLRYYPQETLACHLVGFLGGEGKGQYGAEGYYDKELKGSVGYEQGQRGPTIYLLKDSVKKGQDLNLTIDYNIQFMAEKLLQKAGEQLNIEGGTIIVGQPDSGRLIALANVPTFDPNEYGKEADIKVFENAAIQKTYEPGSAFKPITMAAALDSQKISPQTIYEDEGAIKIGGYIIYNYDQRSWGQRSMTEVLERSINTGAVFAERQAGHETFLEYVERFGFFELTGIDLQGEVFSGNSNLRNGREINFATASFGQGIEITPLQLFRAFSAIANGGKLVTPYLAKSSPPKANDTSLRQVISPKTASQLTAMLVSVVENGFGKAARIPGYFVAGKTGTAEVPWTDLNIDKPGYSDKTIQSFIGFAPAFNPRFLILVKLDNPETKTAEYSAAPIFRDLAKYIIDYWQIPPEE